LRHRQTGKVACAKHPRLWRGPLGLSAASEPAAQITLPDGKIVYSTDADVDGAPSPTRERIGAQSRRGTIEPERYRPNLVISTPASRTAGPAAT
jgi:hypothetical protein